MSTEAIPAGSPQPPERERMALTGSNAQAFFEAVTNPPAPNQKLIAAFRRHEAVVS